MIVSTKYRFVCMCCPKTGSTSVRHFLNTNYNTTEWHYPTLPEAKDSEIRPHINHLPKSFEDFFIFAVVRNPYHLIASRYRFFGKKHFPFSSFEQYVKADPSNTLFKKLHQNEDYEPPEGHVRFKLNAFVKLENIKEEMLKLPFINNTDNLMQLNKNTSPEKVYFSNELIQIVQQGMADDFKHFEYSTKCPSELKLTEIKLM